MNARQTLNQLSYVPSPALVSQPTEAPFLHLEKKNQGHGPHWEGPLIMLAYGCICKVQMEPWAL